MKDCEYCKTPFKVRGIKRFCSRKCKNLIGKGVGYRAYKGSSCVACGFIPEHPCQLDVDHIDGDHSNNSVDNLQTLCANCHRLKTYR